VNAQDELYIFQPKTKERKKEKIILITYNFPAGRLPSISSASFFVCTSPPASVSLAARRPSGYFFFGAVITNVSAGSRE
jgi:hypothetical protein